MAVYQQHTLGAPVLWAGIGLHTGEASSVTVHPAPINSGIRLIRADAPGWDEPVRVHPGMVTNTNLCTALTHKDSCVLTVEHLFAALAAMGLDNGVVEVDGPEIPALDGSSAVFSARLNDVGVIAQDAPRHVLRVTKPFELRDGERWARIEPSDAFELDVSIDFAAGAIGAQRWRGALTPQRFAAQISPARTFAFKKDVDALRAAGRALGGSLDNCVVVDDQTVVNDGGLRFADEFVRHKVLDVIGDLFTLGLPVLGRYTVHRPGHGLNNAMARAINDSAVLDVARVESPTAPRQRSVILAAE